MRPQLVLNRQCAHRQRIGKRQVGIAEAIRVLFGIHKPLSDRSPEFSVAKSAIGDVLEAADFSAFSATPCFLYHFQPKNRMSSAKTT
jgi:hypothetical protein